ncbi:hybrid sensor histidine kinase/response regulator transcription factor [Flavobacterium sp. AED]|uniref:hybrid sensor histidine kinase/response regulator transcription factor n=1 Tax=Flavobacterium sp. AED TaxID=1423323 RepID=UPI00057F3DE2|nr:hybrid sensor histidine kinase/response regulator transcription factor [Flavobacterium sp. AED]KIA87682.1 chemotaxis protein CheY [Flavobacterium sp. AED]
MFSNKNSTLFLFFLFITASLFSQNSFDNFQFLTIKEGISKRAVSSISQDHYGFMWFGTDGAGLYKYDGINYTNYEYDWKNKNAINSNLIYATYIDSYNRLWVGTDEGLCLYNRNLNKFENIDLKNAFTKGYKNIVTVKSIIQDNIGNLLVGTYAHGLFKLNLKTFKMESIQLNSPLNSDSKINCFVKNKKGILYLGTDLGVIEYDSKSNKVKKSTWNTKKISITDPIETLYLDTSENLWVGTISNGLLKISGNQKTAQIERFQISKNKILSIIGVNSHTLMCGTENDGLFLINDKGTIIHRYLNSKSDSHSLKSNSIWSLFLDKDKRIWLGYYNKGVGVFDKRHAKFNVIESLPTNTNSLQTNSVTGIEKDNSGKLWISMEGGGVDVLDSSTKVFKHINNKDTKNYSGLTSNNILTVFIDSKQNIWLGSWNDGIYFLKKGSKTFVNFTSKNTTGLRSDQIFSFSEDSKGIIWIGSYMRGLHYYEPQKKEFHHCDSQPFVTNNLNTANIRKVLVDSRNVIWVATIDGLYQVHRNPNATFSVVSMKNVMSKSIKSNKSTNTILSLYESKNKIIWIGTAGSGLFSYDAKNNKLAWYTDFPEFKEKLVVAITESRDGAIWISGKTGITKLDLKNKKAVNFSTDDGLLSNDFNNNAVLNDRNGDLYFGSYEGINYFNPNKTSNDIKEPLLYLDDFKLFNESIHPNESQSPLTKVISETDHITLRYDQSVFTIDYIGLNYSYPSANEYAYYLEGFEKNWNYVGNKRSATYTNLAPGKYVFKVKSAARGGIWNKKPLQLYIEILPPWWRTSFAYFFYLLLLAGTFYASNKYFQNRFKEKQAVKFERDKAIQIEKLNTKKLQFFTNISHEFRTPLTLILNPLTDLIKNKSPELSHDVINKLQIMHKSSDRLSKLINELMDFNKLQFNQVVVQVQKIEVVSFTKDIISYFEEEASSRRITVVFESNIAELHDWLDPKMVEKIIFNIVSNAFKVTADDGFIKVQINVSQKTAQFPLTNIEKEIPYFEIAIADTGAGLDKKDIKKIFDRFYQVNNLSKAYYGSTGIGLEVVRGFVELQKGKIEVESELGIGSTFTVAFPLGNDFFTENEIVKETFKREGKITPHLLSILNKEKPSEQASEKVHTILIVEDNTELRNYLKNELKNEYKVLVAENGQKGLEMALEKSPDIIMTDVIMPIMNGLDLCKNIKKDIKTSHIPLLMLSAKAMVKDKLEGIDSGADIYLSKPFDMDILKSSLAQLLTSRQIMFNKFYHGITKKAKAKTTTVDNEFIQKALNFIHENINESDLSVEVLATKVFLSRSQLYRKIKTLTGVSVNEFIRNVRLEKAKELIALGNDNINEISYKVGFTSSSYFTKCFKEKYGHLPTHKKDDSNV